MIRTDDIIGVIFGRVGDGFRNRGIGRKMDGGDYLMVPARIPYGRRIRDVAID